MNKKTKMWLGLGLVAVAAYYFWEKSAKDTASDAAKAAAPKANASGGCPSGSTRVDSLTGSFCVKTGTNQIVKNL